MTADQPTDQPTDESVEPSSVDLANTCLHCSQTREQHSSDRLACVKAGYYGNRFTASLNATITVAFGDAEPIVITLDGAELGESSWGNRYLTNASRGFIADEVERALIALLAQQDD
jgi:hypothetical protein